MSIFLKFMLFLFPCLLFADRVSITAGRVDIVGGRVAMASSVPYTNMVMYFDNASTYGPNDPHIHVATTIPTSVFELTRPWSASVWGFHTGTASSWVNGLLTFTANTAYTYQMLFGLRGAAVDPNHVLADTYAPAAGVVFSQTPAPPIAPYTLNHYCLTYDGSVLRVFVNAVEVITLTTAMPPRISEYFGIGSSYASVNSRYTWIGAFDQVALWTNTLSAVAVTNLYNGGEGVAISPSSPDLIGLWNFDGNVNDSSPFNHTTALVTTEGDTYQYIAWGDWPVEPPPPPTPTVFATLTYAGNTYGPYQATYTAEYYQWDVFIPEMGMSAFLSWDTAEPFSGNWSSYYEWYYGGGGGSNANEDFYDYYDWEMTQYMFWDYELAP